MVKGPTNPLLKRLIGKVEAHARKTKSPFWKKVATELSKPTRAKKGVNLSKINRYTKDGDVIIVTSKILSAGSLDKKVTVITNSSSDKAREKLKSLKLLSIEDALEKHPKGTGVKFIK